MLHQPVKAAEVERYAGRYVDLAAPDWKLDTTTHPYIAAYEDGRCLVVRDKAGDPAVRQVLDQLEKRLGRTLRREYVTLDDIAEARRIGIAGRRGHAAEGGMQSRILDLIDAAHRLDASDIHIEVGAEICVIQFRVDGRLLRQESWMAERGLAFLGAAYAMADVANASYSPAKYLAARLAPRPDKDDWAFPEGIEAVRMQFNPVAFGTSYAVFRLLGVTRATHGLEQLGFEPEQLQLLMTFARKTKGLAIISGPTGSGKSTTMCAVLSRVRDADAAAGTPRALFTVEDPPERRLLGAQQLAVPNTDTDEARAKAYADAIRAAMRSDPDQIMIGEIRDRTTANLALSASMTGHQVWSTLHCTSAHAIPLRLTDLGVDRTTIFGAGELYVAAAQVLVPLLCPDCRLDREAARRSARLSAAETAAFTKAFGETFHIAGPGCLACKGTGVRGRTVLAEVVRTDADYLSVLARDGIEAARRFSVARGEASIAQVGARKVAAGLVSALDVSRIVDLEELRSDTGSVS